jgi:dTDP-4-amino-4,6-dideoxygalactose transaminase
MVAERRLLAAGYRERLAPLHAAGRLSWQVAADSALHAYQTFAILLAEGVDRERVRARCAEREIEVGPATYAFHRAASHAAAARRAGQLPVADALHQRGLALPLYVGMRSAELDRVCERLGEVLS